MNSDVTFASADPGPSSGAIVEINLEGEILNWFLMPKLILHVHKTRTVKTKKVVEAPAEVKGQVADVVVEKPLKITKDGIHTDTDTAALSAWFKKTFTGSKVYFGIEDVSIFQAPISRNIVGYFQKNKGILMALAHVYAKKIFMVKPKTWQDEFGIKRADKDRSIMIACEIFPELADIIATVPPASKHGLAEAALGAEYIRRKYVWVFSQKENVCKQAR